ncbi:MAG: 4-hydroxy-3-methylbut-2-enyl diphosphate reductase [Gemmatimonadota bacterium]|nr:4-hydroxy-3-methylbut-2-enyl diphosphate reductase [Gemmatimonadota bacterium]MDH4349546.1 4-hydroxy-3-methylbut-2-enyl diphosphate reductase [Gemmatimonadota bacterium]MDH5195712.1 4-hydroxy-3-methylbut-2-enyl diphosphate reductase [Gemmatimonadota bacterium]
MDPTYVRKGFGLKREIEPELASYHSNVVDRLKAGGYAHTVGDLTFRLAQEFGFCYGVDRAVEYAYESRKKFPDKQLYLVGEIIHNPHVNARLTELGVTILGYDPDGAFDFSRISAEDVVLMPAFGVTVKDFERLRAIGCVVVDTTCGSVLNVWKRVERYAKEGFTAVVHGKHYHEETKATVSQVTKYEHGKYLILFDMDEAEVVCRFIERADNGGEMERLFRHRVSDGFEFARDLQKIGVANQTTMLAKESLAIAARIGQSLEARYGRADLDEHFRSFDTICSATQDRQDAVLALIEEPLDVMLVIGGYNSSNTNNLAKICATKVRTYHIADASCIDVEARSIRHKPVDEAEEREEREEREWLEGVRRIGLTAGASTPNNKIGEAVERVLETKGLRLDG